MGFLVFSDHNIIDLGLMCSSSQKRIMEMQCDLLVSNFKDLKTIALVKENIGNVSDGSSSHSADALKLGLKMAFELKRQNCARLRCSHGNCPWYNSHPSYSTVGPTIHCQSCIDRGWGNRYLQCVSCGYQRTGTSYSSCQSCRKMFI